MRYFHFYKFNNDVIALSDRVGGKFVQAEPLHYPHGDEQTKSYLLHVNLDVLLF